MKTFKINSFDSINDFLFEIYFRSRKKFDPSENLMTLKDYTGNEVFTKEESAYLDSVMMECFVFCILNDLNIYTLATMVQYDVSQIKASV